MWGASVTSKILRSRLRKARKSLRLSVASSRAALPITHEDLAETVGEPGRYRLEAFDGNGQNISGCVAVTEVVFDEDAPASTATVNAADAMPHLIQLVG